MDSDRGEAVSCICLKAKAGNRTGNAILTQESQLWCMFF